MTALRKESHYPGKVAIKRAVEAAKACGIEVGGFEVTPDGVIRIIRQGNEPAAQQDEFSQWLAAGKLG